jgi:AraC-like DNA-binding protein
MPLQVLIFILLFGLLQGVLMAFILLCRKNLKAFHFFLSAYIVVLLFQIGFKVLSKVWLMEQWPPVYSLSYYLPFLYGPLLYFIARSTVTKFAFTPKNLLHFLPFFLFTLFFAFKPENLKFTTPVFYLFHPIVRLVLQLLSLFCYHIVAIKTISRFKKNARHLSLHIAFVQRMVRTSFVVTSFIACALCFMYIAFPNYQHIRWTFVLLSVFIYWISLVALQKPGSFEVFVGNLEANVPVNAIRSVLTILPPEIKYMNSGLKNEQANQIIRSLQEAMESKQLFLDSTITIEKLAALLPCQKHHLSQALNDKLGVSFNEYINQKRTEAAKQMLSDPGKNHYTIASIAYDAGFNSLSTFNDVFKKISGLTPSQYRKMNLEESRQERI